MTLKLKDRALTRSVVLVICRLLKKFLLPTQSENNLRHYFFILKRSLVMLTVFDRFGIFNASITSKCEQNSAAAAGRRQYIWRRTLFYIHPDGPARL